MIDEIAFGEETISYEINYVSRKSLGISVNPEMKVLVKSPEGVPIEKIREKVKKRAPWILKQRDFFLSFHPRISARQYVSGETFLYMGRQFLLKVNVSDKNEVRYKGRFIEVKTNKKDKAKSLVKDWYRERAKIKFPEIAEPLIKRFQKYKVQPSGVYIQEMPQRWGSCTPSGKIILNPELIKAPKPCIQYVIIHELCHLVHRNHSSAFFALQEREMPDWKRWKEKLEFLLA